MSLSKKTDTFCSKSMHGSPVSAVPGVGPALARHLRDKGIVTAPDLYRIFLRCNSDRETFLSWSNSNCKFRVKDFESCFNGFTRYKFQYPLDYQENTDPQTSSSGNNTRSRGGNAARNVSFQNANAAATDSMEESDNDITHSRDDIGTPDPLIPFFVSIRQTIQRLPKLNQLQLKDQIYSIVSNAEAQYWQSQEVVNASTSAGNSHH